MEARRLPDGQPARERRWPPDGGEADDREADDREVDRRENDRARPRLAGLARGPDRRRLVVAVVAAVIAVGALVFWVQNHEHISISYLSVTIRAPLWLTVTAYLLVGVLIGVLVTLYYQRRR
jgi:uncharacterized integral membrane protein